MCCNFATDAEIAKRSFRELKDYGGFQQCRDIDTTNTRVLVRTILLIVKFIADILLVTVWIRQARKLD